MNIRTSHLVIQLPFFQAVQFVSTVASFTVTGFFNLS